MKFGRGLIHREHGTFPAFRSMPGVPVNGRADLSDFVPGIFGQGFVGSCEAHRTVGAVATTLAVRGFPLPWFPSPDDVYRIARCLDRREYGPEGALQDIGTTTHNALNAIARWGMRPMGAMVEGRFSDCGGSNLNAEPLFVDLLKDAETLIVGAYEIESTGLSRAIDVCHALDAGMAVGVDIWVDTRGPRSVEDWDPSTGPLDAPDKMDADGGGHAVYLVGYEWIGDRVTFWGPNSWGDWGASGYIHGSRAWLDAALGVCIFDARRAS